ncbi:hypothetical protein RHS02_02490, partial [Rhizoctonia solani]
MSRTGPPHYHQGSANLCHCAFSESYHNTSAPYIYPSAPAPAPPPAGRPRPIAGHPSEYAPAIRRVPKPKPTNKIAKSRDMKFDEDTWQWYFETPDAPGVRWLESVRHIEDLPQAKDPDFASMLNEYYMAGHVIDMPDQERLPVVPGGLGKGWRYKRAAPPPAVQKQPTQHPPAPAQPQTWIEPIYHQRYPAAPQYAGGSAHPVSMRPNHDGWRVYSSAPPHEFPRALHETRHPSEGSERLGPLPGTPGPRHYVDASAHRGYRPPSPDDSPSEESEDEEDEDEDDESDDSYNYPELHRSRSYAPPPPPKPPHHAQRLRERGYRVTDPHTNVDPDGLDAPALAMGKHGRSASSPNVPPAKTYQKIEIHRVLQTRTTLGVSRMPDLVFDLRYDPRHAFDRSDEPGPVDLTTAPAFQPGQTFVRFLIRHPFGGRGGDWVQDVEDAQYLTVMGVLRIISGMVHRNIDQHLDWDPLSEFDKSFVYEAYLNRPCPDEDAAGRRLHLFCEKYMFGGIEQLPFKAKGTTAEGPTFSVKLIKNSKLKRYDKLSGFRIPSGKGRWTGRGDTTYPYLIDDMASSRRVE